MEFYSISLPNVIPVKLVTAKATYGVGFLTAFVGGFCSLLGIPNNMFVEKLKKSETLAMEDLEKSAQAVGADGVMDVRCQIDGLSFLVSGTAYKLSPEEKTKREAEEKDISPKTTKAVETKQNTSQPKVEKKKEETIKILPCPNCGEDLDFMGWDGNELKEKHTCPLCGEEILFNK